MAKPILSIAKGAVKQSFSMRLAERPTNYFALAFALFHDGIATGSQESNEALLTSVSGSSDILIWTV